MALDLTWNQPSSSPLASLSPGFFDHPILPTSIAIEDYQPRTRDGHQHIPPIATNATCTGFLPGPRLASINITERLFSVKTFRSTIISIAPGRVSRWLTFVDGLWINSYVLISADAEAATLYLLYKAPTSFIV